MSRREKYKAFEKCIIKTSNGHPMLVFKLSNNYLNYYNLKTLYPLSSIVLVENASKKEYRKLRNKFRRETRLKELDKLRQTHNENAPSEVPIYPVPTQRSENKVIRKNCPSLIIDTGKKPMLVYDLGNCYLNAYTMRNTYPRTSKILVKNATKKDYAYSSSKETNEHETKREIKKIDIMHQTIQNNPKVVANWIELRINSEIDLHIDNIANNLNSNINKSNANLLIYDLEIIRNEAESKMADIQRVINKINNRLLEIGRKSMLRKGDIVCSDKTRDLFLKNNVFRNAPYLNYKYRITKVRLKPNMDVKYIISEKNSDNKWLPITIANSKTWLCFDSYAEAKQYTIKLVNFGPDEL